MAKRNSPKKEETKAKGKVTEKKVEEQAAPAEQVVENPVQETAEQKPESTDVKVEEQATETPAEEQATEALAEEGEKVEEKAEEGESTEAPAEEGEKAEEKTEEQAAVEPGLFGKAMKEFEAAIPEDKFKAKENNSGVTYFGAEGTRIFKIIETKKGFKIEFNVAVSPVEGLTTLTEAEAAEKHMGTCRWIYIGTDIQIAKKLIEEAVQKFAPKKRADSKEEKDKKEQAQEKQPAKTDKPATNKKQSTPKENKNKNYNKENQTHAKNGPVEARKMTPEELEKYKAGQK